jgi:hypothetical protein
LYQINFKKPKDKFKIERDSTGKTIREIKITRDSLQLQLGATYAPATTINGNYTYLSETFFGNGQFTTDFIDTSLYINQQCSCGNAHCLGRTHTHIKMSRSFHPWPQHPQPDIRLCTRGRSPRP